MQILPNGSLAREREVPVVSLLLVLVRSRVAREAYKHVVSRHRECQVSHLQVSRD
jgi:hypothetical protein